MYILQISLHWQLERTEQFNLPCLAAGVSRLWPLARWEMQQCDVHQWVGGCDWVNQWCFPWWQLGDQPWRWWVCSFLWVPLLSGWEVYFFPFSTLKYFIVSNFRKPKDHHNWAEMVQRQDITWEAQMPALVDAYLLWKYGSENHDVSTESFTITTLVLDSKSFIHCVNFLTYKVIDYSDKHVFNHIQGCAYLNITLLYYSFLSCNPINPSISFTIPTLKMFRRLCLQSSHISIQAWVWVLCDIHNICQFYLNWLQKHNIYYTDQLPALPMWTVLSCIWHIFSYPAMNQQ